MSIHSCSLGAPILLEEAEAAGVKPAPKGAAAARMLVSNDLAQRRRLFGPEVYYCEGSHRADHRCGFGPRSRCMQHRQTLRRSLWRALRRCTVWMAGCRHMPLLLMCHSSAMRPGPRSRDGKGGALAMRRPVGRGHRAVYGDSARANDRQVATQAEVRPVAAAPFLSEEGC
jgi:hypothetical protein